MNFRNTIFAKRISVHVGAFWTTIFLLPTFFQRLFIGGEETATYQDFDGIDLVIIGYVCHLIIVTKYLATPGPAAVGRFVVARFFPLLVISALHIFVLQFSGPIGADSASLAIARQLLWVLSCLVMVRFTTPDLLLTRLIQLSHFTFGVIALTYVSYMLTEVPAQLILRSGVPRAQGFLTEPSAVGCLLAGYSALAMHEKRWRRVMLAAAVSLLVNSVISYVGFVVGVLSGAIQLFVSSPLGRRACIVGLLLIVPTSLVVLPVFSSEISAAASSMMLNLEGTKFSESYLYVFLIQRILEAASLVDAGVGSIKAGLNDVGGGIFRFTSVLLLLEHMQQSWHLYFGYGLGAHAQLMEAADQSLIDFGILPFALSSLGLFGGLGIFGWLVWTVSRSTAPLAVYAVPFLAIISLNSAGGIHMYSVALLAAFLLSLEAGERVRQLRSRLGSRRAHMVSGRMSSSSQV